MDTKILPNGFLLAAKYEELQAKEEDPEEALNEYQLICNDLTGLIIELDKRRQNKVERTLKDEENDKETSVEGSLYTMQMRQLNRVEKIRTKNMRDDLFKAKQQVDALQLQLENSLCEILHVRKEVDKCLHFKSRDQNIELIPVEEFYEEAPESVSCPEVTKEDGHKLRLARLKWELKRRKELSSYYEHLLVKKKVVSKAIREKKGEMDNLVPLFKDMINVTKPMQNFLGTPNPQSYGTHEAAGLLPQQLYLLYVQTDAYRVACDKNLSVTVLGDISKARSFTIPIIKVPSGEESDSERKVPSSKRKKELQKNLLVRHPLSVQLKIFLKGGDVITLEFSLLVNLNILTVVPKLELAEPIKCSMAKAVVSNEKILCELFAGDIGLESPNIVNYYQLRQVGIEKLGSLDWGFPYIWVQRMGGLDFAGNENRDGCVEPKKEVSLPTVPNVIKEIRQRVRTRLGLVSQLLSIGSRKVLPPEHMAEIELNCRLKRWDAITWDEYYKYECTVQLIENQYVAQCDLFYRAIVIRGEAQVNLLIAVKGCYPHIPPTFSVILDYKDETYTSLNNDNIRDIEAEVNVYWKESLSSSEQSQVWNFLLMRQLYRTMICCDIFLECQFPDDFTGEKPFLQPYSSEKNEAHPYKFIQQSGGGIFTQR